MATQYVISVKPMLSNSEAIANKANSLPGPFG